MDRILQELRTATRKSWYAMLARCYHPSTNMFYRYGGRGIEVCPEWRHSFDSFLRDMGIRPEGYCLGRLNHDRNYWRGNCCWQPDELKQRDTSQVRLLTLNGITLPMKTWAKRLQMNHQTIQKRLDRGWTVERALLTPSIKQMFNRSM